MRGGKHGEVFEKKGKISNYNNGIYLSFFIHIYPI